MNKLMRSPQHREGPQSSSWGVLATTIFATLSALLALGLSPRAGADEITADASAGQAKAAVCAACHGAQGVSPASAFPHLAGQQAHYLRKQITDIRESRRAVPQMAGLTDTLSDQDIADIAAYYAEQPANRGQAEPDAAKAGEVLYRAGSLERGIAACTACHGPRGEGIDSAGYPALAGQFPAYTITSLTAFRDGTRDNDPNDIMSSIAARMSDSDMQQVAEYLHGLR
ncbi:c-type cytochrome [Cobetia sp. 14N.309.X.WAT.E.A4]|uniref:c-type cytochrome n=1 Tax=Cobetia sp. 14N.309.X.WAT.E.A4 TaxID=2998323 RepID=UPI0025AF0974|nr:c-type cytochrome [Cobetia sp. 14N.309.X.WAT.E.A4]MDN2656247.1 c-type cytochrome [Cobetia sp. 14N.309.X.WAT.E.A4]